MTTTDETETTARAELRERLNDVLTQYQIPFPNPGFVDALTAVIASEVRLMLREARGDD